MVTSELVMPTRWSAPPAVSNRLREVEEICARCGLVLDEWERFVLEHALGLRSSGKWAAREVGVCVPRQNGKGAILEARELAALFVFGDRTVIHSAHQFDTSMEAFLRMEGLIEEGGLQVELKPRSGVSRSHGSEGFFLRSGQRLRYRTRTKGGGRGFTGDLLIFDEAMVLPDIFLSAVMPIISARTVEGNPQIWYTGSAVDQLVHEYGRVFARARGRGLKGDKSLAWFEYAALDDPDARPEDAVDVLDDREAWRQANPALGIRISEDYIEETERGALDDRGFAVERLGIGDWPDVSIVGSMIDLRVWDGLVDITSSIPGQPTFAFDVSPSRTSAAISAAGARGDLIHVETVQHERDGIGWLLPSLEEKIKRHRAAKVICDGASPGAVLIPDLEKLGVQVEALSAQEYARACGGFFDRVNQRGLRHLGTTEMRSAIKGAATRPLGDAWAWSRKNSGVDITPLVAATLAVWGASAPTAQAWASAW